ncbi:hypothetical protein D3C87_1757950 [compost metagenome]
MVEEPLEDCSCRGMIGDQLQRPGRDDDRLEALVIGKGLEGLLRQRRRQRTFRTMSLAIAEHVLRGIETADVKASFEQRDQGSTVANGRLQYRTGALLQALSIIFNITKGLSNIFV